MPFQSRIVKDSLIFLSPSFHHAVSIAFSLSHSLSVLFIHTEVQVENTLHISVSADFIIWMVTWFYCNFNNNSVSRGPKLDFSIFTLKSPLEPNEIYRCWTTIPFTSPDKKSSKSIFFPISLLGASAFQDGGGILRESVDGIIDDKATTLPKFF